MATNKREYRAFNSMRAKGEVEEDSKKYIAEGYATTFDVPYLLFEDDDGTKYFERIDPNALKDADMADVVFRFDHEGHVFARTKNGTLTISTDDHGMKVVADLGGTEDGRKMWEEINAGLIYKMSWAFVVQEDKYDRETRTRTILKIRKVYDVSAVTFPADDDTDISVRSFVDGVIGKEQAERLERRRMALVIATLGIPAGNPK